MWTPLARVLAASLLSTLALSACSGDDGDDTATDPAGSSTEETPTAEPTVGTYPAFGAEDYAYTLRVSCFCPDAGVPIRITVQDGDVAEAVFATKGPGHRAGDPAPEYSELTIDEIIDVVNAATEAESVQVDWPEGQDYPSEISIDQSSRIADEEIGYAISRVEVG